MIVKSLVLLLIVYTADTNSLEYTYDHLAGGWLKFHKPASWSDASIRCDSEGAVLASPETSQIRDAIKDYVARVGQSGATILSGVQADFSSGDYYTLNGVSLEKLPVTIEVGASIDYKSSESCVKWMTGKASVKVVSCDQEFPFVCFKKRKTVVVTGCGTPDSEYKYEARSGSCYKFHRNGLNWLKAYAKCKNEGGYLAIINSKLENEVLTELFAKNPNSVITASQYASKDYAFLGFRDWLDGESWKTVHGQTLSQAGFSEWAPGEPNNGHGDEHCGSIYREGNYNDADCIYEYAFICEKNPDILYK